MAVHRKSFPIARCHVGWSCWSTSSDFNLCPSIARLGSGDASIRSEAEWAMNVATANLCLAYVVGSDVSNFSLLEGKTRLDHHVGCRRFHETIRQDKARKALPRLVTLRPKRKSTRVAPEEGTHRGANHGIRYQIGSPASYRSAQRGL